MRDDADIVAQLAREGEAIPQGGGGVEALPVRQSHYLKSKDFEALLEGFWRR